MSTICLTLSGEEANTLEWALEHMRARTDQEDEVRWIIHERLFALRPAQDDPR